MPSDVRGRRSRAFNVERKLVKMLSANKANHVFRVPVSGSRSFPDVFLVNNVRDLVVAFEVKTTQESKVKVRREQVSRLFSFIEAFKKYANREAVVAVWFSREGKWVFKRLDGLLSEDVVVSADEESNWSPP
ncbi:MAG: hypothetical protein LM563_00820 [Thermofilum sp.]|jgi:Holliday junction resolvase|nr:hypothetical protein [Thermofilum sp.]